MPAISSFISLTATSELRLGGAPLALRVDRRARRLRLRVDRRAAGLILTIPSGVSRRRALEWATSHENWAEQALRALPKRAELGPDSVVYLFGEAHRIDWDPVRSRRIVLEKDRIVCGGPLEGLEGRLVRWLRGQALALLDSETRYYAAKLGLHVARVGIGDPVSRWGSCSSSGSIRYSWRLILAPEFVRRATVAHEVAHLVHMDHGPAFHALVEQLLGTDPKPARLWLRHNGAALHRLGR
jgi:predicted metal-dependent hydrolase